MEKAEIDHLRSIGTMLQDGYIVSDSTGVVLQAADEIERLREACQSAIEWLEGWDSAEPYLSCLRAALAPQGAA